MFFSVVKHRLLMSHHRLPGGSFDFTPAHGFCCTGRYRSSMRAQHAARCCTPASPGAAAACAVYASVSASLS